MPHDKISKNRTSRLLEAGIDRYKKNVLMGNSEIIKAGSEGILHSGSLLVCSIFVGKVFRNKQYLCTIMCHRGLETQFEFARKAEIALSEYGYLRELTVKPIALRTAPNTDTSDYYDRMTPPSPQGQHATTDDEIILNLDFLFRIKPEELYKLKEFGQGVSPGINVCIATVDVKGNVTVPKRTGMYEMQNSMR